MLARSADLRRFILVPTAACALGLALLLGAASPTPAQASVVASKVKRCAGDQAEALKLRVRNISCGKALKKVVSRNDSRKWRPDDCTPFTLDTCRSKVAGFKCTHRKKPKDFYVLIRSKCTKKPRNGKRRNTKVIRWDVGAAG
jgi:hypothetical protein